MKVLPITSATLIAGLGLLAAVTLAPRESSAGEPATRVILNGKATPVFFNDGDSFRVLKGKMKGAKARLFGYNTLESYGAVHQWGDWTAKELYYIAKMSALHARAGVWTCTTDGKTDTYGRMLVNCPGLAEDLVRRGWAHALSINDDPAQDFLLKAQHEAIAAVEAFSLPEEECTPR